MKKVLVAVTILLLIIVVIESIYIAQREFFKKDIVKEKIIPKPLLAYTFENLKQTDFPSTQISFGDVVDDTDEYTQRLFYFTTPKRPGSDERDKVSGLATIPKKEGDFPVIVMFRGFIPEESFISGAGTSPSARELAKRGFITLAPDFLGFGQSASPSADPFEGRFQTYTTGLSLLSSLKTLNSGLDKEYVGTISADLKKVGIWGHSNGGHIALSVLAISGIKYPTVLWAPVSKSFPYSILYYTDETDDQGKGLRDALYSFEELYNTQSFSPERYYKWIKAPIEINQGTGDQEVPYWWSDELAEILKKYDVDVTYNTYPGANHNMVPYWQDAVNNTIDFYNKNFENQQNK